MSTEIVMPNLGFDTQTGMLVEWLKQPGDTVAKGEIIAIIESDKANVELESIAAGVLVAHLFSEGDEVPVGAAIARLSGEKDGAAAAVPTKSSVPAAIKPARVEATPIAKRLAAENDLDLAQIPGSGPRGRIKREDVEAYLAGRETTVAEKVTGILRALPKVRRAAREAGIDLAQVAASGGQGIISLADVQAYQTSQTPSPVPAEPRPDAVKEIPISRVRQIIGRRLGESKREAPHFYVTGEFDLEAALQKLQTMAAPQPRLNDLIQYLTVQTLRRVPALNATFVDGHLYQHDNVNLAIAVAREDGLITPVLSKAERYSLTGLAAESDELVQRTRANRLSPEMLQGGTFTISNLGVIRQVDQFTAVINPPQVAILAVGTIKQRPLVSDGGLYIHHTVHLTLSGDHRVIDGMHLGHFMAAFQEELNQFS